MTDLEREAREAAKKRFPDCLDIDLVPVHDRWGRKAFIDGYLAAAAPREQEIERLRTDLAKTKLPIWMLREEHEKEVAALRARVEELEGMVPRWVTPRSEEFDDLLLADWMCHWPQCMKDRWLMVPPIPPPEGES